MKEILKNGVSLWLRTIIVTVMCFFICVSISVLTSAAFSEEIGYDAYGYKEDSEEGELLYTYYTADGEDTKKTEYEAQGYTVKTTEKTQITKTGNVVFLAVTQIFCTLLLVAFVYPNLWQLGTKDSNLVKFKHKNADNLKGLKIGLIGSIPAVLMYIAFIVCKYASPKFPTALYRFLNCSNYTFIQLICGDAVYVGDVAVWRLILLILPLIIVPATAFAAYLLGFKDISLGERFVYKKNKTK